MNFTHGLQETLLRNGFPGGRSQTYDSPLKPPKNIENRERQKLRRQSKPRL